MKFSRQLEACVINEWRGMYIDYKALKKSLNAAVLATRGSRQVSSLRRRRPCPDSNVGQSDGVETSPASAESQEEDPIMSWTQDVQAAAVKAGQFLQSRVALLEQHLGALSRLCSETFGTSTSSADAPSGCASTTCSKADELRLLSALSRKADLARKLRQFAEVNHVALFKILKKYDKRLPADDGLSELLPSFTAESGLACYDCLDRVDAEIKRLSLQSDRCGGLGNVISSRALHLAAGMGPMTHYDLQQQQVLFFFLGGCTGLLLGIVVLICLPPINTEEMPFSVAYFLAPFPVFRFCLSVCLCLWAAGFVTMVCDSRGINYRFLLNVNPTCRLGPVFFFSRAAALTSVWILVFALYIIDYKWLTLSPVRPSSGHAFNKRASWHYAIYPSVLLAVVLVGLLLPSKLARRRHIRGAFKTFGRAMLPPFFAVTFEDNLVGDILTSLVKPLQAFPPSLCYLFSTHPQTKSAIEKFRSQGDTCPEWTAEACKVAIAALPLWWRALQCLRRYRDHRVSRHLLNCGKYTCALMVVGVSYAFSDKLPLVFCMQALATLYAIYWDLVFDWGLKPRLHPQQRAVHARQAMIPPQPSEGSTDNHQGSSWNLVDRFFRRRIYVLAAVFDVLARLTWVQTLVPVRILTHDIIDREIILIVLLAIEIARRSVWAILRLAHEQHCNAEGYRRVLWVPDVMLSPALASGEESGLDEDDEAAWKAPCREGAAPLLRGTEKDGGEVARSAVRVSAED